MSAPYISEIESGKKDGNITVIGKIAAPLKVNLDNLV